MSQGSAGTFLGALHAVAWHVLACQPGAVAIAVVQSRLTGEPPACPSGCWSARRRSAPPAGAARQGAGVGACRVDKQQQCQASVAQGREPVPGTGTACQSHSQRNAVADGGGRPCAAGCRAGRQCATPPSTWLQLSIPGDRSAQNRQPMRAPQVAQCTSATCISPCARTG